MKRSFDNRLCDRTKETRVGDFVVVRREEGRKPPVQRHKLAKKADGPYRVVATHDDTVEIIRNGIRDEISPACIERAKPPTVTYPEREMA